MKTCKSCQTQIDEKAKKCPNCRADQRGWFRRHPILTVLLALFILGVVGGIAGSGKSKSTDTNSSSSQQASQTQAQEPKVIEASALADAFDANKVAAENEWKGKLVQFSAEVTNITDSGLSFSKVSSKQVSFTQISCRIKDKQQLLSLKNGQTVTVRGTVGTQTIGVIDLSDCEVVK